MKFDSVIKKFVKKHDRAGGDWSSSKMDKAVYFKTCDEDLEIEVELTKDIITISVVYKNGVQFLFAHNIFTEEQKVLRKALCEKECIRFSFKDGVQDQVVKQRLNSLIDILGMK